MLGLRDLWLFEVFVAVVDCGSMSAAGHRLHMSTPAISEAMANLESKVGLRLLVRSPTGSRATAEGREVYDCARLLLENTRRVLDDVSGISADDDSTRRRYRVGSVLGGHSATITAAATVCHSPVTGVSMSIRNPGFELLSGEVDMALLMGPTEYDAKLERRYVFSERRMILGSETTIDPLDSTTIDVLDEFVWPSIPPKTDRTYLAPWLCCDVRGGYPPRQGPALTDPFDLVAWLQAEPEAVVATTPALARLFTAELPLTTRPIEGAPGWRVDLVRRADDPNHHFDTIAAALTANAPEGAYVDTDARVIDAGSDRRPTSKRSTAP